MRGFCRRQQELKVFEDIQTDENIREISQDEGNSLLQFAATISGKVYFICFLDKKFKVIKFEIFQIIENLMILILKAYLD